MLLPDITKKRKGEPSKNQWKSVIKCAVEEKNGKDLKDSMEGMSKLEQMKNEEYLLKPYINEMSMQDARMQFRLRTRMLKFKMNQPSDKTNKATLWECNGCVNVDTQAHILWCPAYQELRVGKSLEEDADLVEYYRKVLLIREKMDI